MRLTTDFGRFDAGALRRVRALLEPLIAFWPFSRLSGTTVYDVGPNAIHLSPRTATNNVDMATFSQPPQFVGATVAMTLDGSSEWLRGSDHDALSPIGAPLSVGAWIKNATAPSNVIIAKNTDVLPTPQEWVFWERDTDGNLEFWLFDSVGAGSIKQTATTALDTEWHLVVGTYDGGSSANGIALYVDGAAVPSTATTVETFTSLRNHATPVSIGAIHEIGDTGQDWFDGAIALPFISATRLSAGTVALLHAETRRLMGI